MTTCCLQHHHTYMEKRLTEFYFGRKFVLCSFDQSEASLNPDSNPPQFFSTNPNPAQKSLNSDSDFYITVPYVPPNAFCGRVALSTFSEAIHLVSRQKFHTSPTYLKRFKIYKSLKSILQIFVVAFSNLGFMLE